MRGASWNQAASSPRRDPAMAPKGQGLAAEDSIAVYHDSQEQIIPRSQEQAARASSTEVAADVNLAGKDGKGGFAVDMGKAPAAAMLAGPPTRLLCLDEKAVPALGMLLQAARPDVLVVTHATDLGAKDVIALAAKAYKEAGCKPLRAICFWHTGLESLTHPEEPEAARKGDSAEVAAQKTAALEAFEAAKKTHKEDCLAMHAKLGSDALELCRGVAPLLEESGRVHFLTYGVLQLEGPIHLDDEEETKLLQNLEFAAKRPVSLGRGEPLEDTFQLLSLDREIVDITHSYFDHELLKHWHFARNRSKTGINPNAMTVAGIQDATDKRMMIMTYIKEIPFLYSVMIGSFLMLFVPENCTSYATVCSNEENTGTGTKFGSFTLFMNCLTAFSFVISDWLFNRREQWMIEWLDADDEFPSTHLKHVIDRYPRIKAALRNHNMHCSTISLWTMTVVVCNFIVSAAYVLRKVGHEEKQCCPGVFPGETKTVTTLVTNTLLVFLKLLHHVRTSKMSLSTGAGISSAHLIPLAYNVIDHDHLDDDMEEAPLAHSTLRLSQVSAKSA